MTVREAFELVYELAEGNCLDWKNCETEELQNEWRRQQQALALVCCYLYEQGLLNSLIG